MKTIKKLLFVAFAAMTISACQEELENPNGGVQGSDKVVTFTGSLDQIETKTTIWYESDMEDGKIETRFMNGDHIMVNGIESGQIDKENSSGTQISFSVQGVEEGPYYAMTAAQVTTKEVEETSVPVYDATSHAYGVTVAGTQNYRKVNDKKETSHDSGAHILAAYSDNESMQFKHMTTFLAITVDAESSEVKDNIKNVYVRQGDGGNIAGSWSLKFDADNEPYMEPSASLSSAITYNCVVTGVSADGVPQGSVMIIGVPSYDYANGLLVTIESVNDQFAVFKINSAKTQFASQGGVIIPCTFSFSPAEARSQISTAAEWNSFATYLKATSGDGASNTITLMDNIVADDLIPITNEFKGVFDGNGKTITINNAKKPLFDTVSGKIKNLTIAGSMAGEVQIRNNYATVLGSPFVGILETGGELTGCTNKMNVTVGTAEQPVAAHVYASGFVSAMYAGTIEGCVNEGKVDVFVDVSASNHNVGIGGFVGDIRPATGNVSLTGCINSETADITLIPKSAASGHGNAMSWCGMGGIAGVLRGTTPLKIDDCDNSADVTLSGSQIKDPQGFAAKVISVGGILGLAAPTSSGLLSDPSGIENFYDVYLVGCDNEGDVYNCATNYATTRQGKRLVFTAGLVGALLGGPSKYAEIETCTNTGMVTTHDYTSEMNTADSNVIPSQRPNFCCVAGGLIGYAGYVNISENCRVQCQIGNGKRQLLAWGGVIGYAIGPFTIDEINVDVTGYFASYTGYAGNRAVVAVVPMKCGTNAMEAVPNITDSTISNSTIKCTLYTLTTPLGSSTTATAAAKLDDLTQLNGNPYVDMFLSNNIQDNLVCGQGFTASDEVTLTNNTYTTAAQ